MPLGVVLAGRVLPDLHIGITHRVGYRQEDAVGQNDAQDQAVEPGISYSPDGEPPDGVGASKDTEGEVPCLCLHQPVVKTTGQLTGSKAPCSRRNTAAELARHIADCILCFKQNNKV